MKHQQLTIPLLAWIKNCDKKSIAADFIAAGIVTALLIPQSLAYAMLAGLPLETGLYASIAPLLAYAMFGSSRTLSIGPVAIISLLTASTIANIADTFSISPSLAAAALALLSGVFLLLMGFFRLGFLTNFLSHAVISGFISASGLLIAISQLKHLLGVPAEGTNAVHILFNTVASAPQSHKLTIIMGLGALLFLLFCRYYLIPLCNKFGVYNKLLDTVVKLSPILAVTVCVLISYLYSLDRYGVAVVGAIPKGLPHLHFQWPSLAVLEALVTPALLISIIGYVESVSIGKTLASKRRQKIDSNQEFIGLGSANVASSVFGGFPVTAGFSRSIVNFEAGAQTQLAGIFASIGIALVCVLFTDVLFYLPKAVLAATIIVAVLSLVDFSIFKKAWRFSKSDFWALGVTAGVTLLFGVEYGLTAGVATSLALFMYRSSTPHIPEVGLLEGTQHFRNIQRFKVLTKPHVLTLRPDQSLYFANIEQLEEHIMRTVFERDKIAHVVLMCSAVNDIDYSAVEILSQINARLSDQGILLHLSEVKGPVMTALENSHFLESLSGKVFISQYDAFSAL